MLNALGLKPAGKPCCYRALFCTRACIFLITIRIMKRTIIVILCFSAFVSMSFLSFKDPPRYKNLKVLPKDITKQQMDTLMKHFANSLGVKCSYCHKYNQQAKSMDFASDSIDKKDIARGMWRMQGKINRKFFKVKNARQPGTELEVSCYTCHHGKAEPSTIAPTPPRQVPAAPPPSKA
jgi:hypothetical protein